VLVVSGASVLAQDGGGTQGDKFILGQNYVLQAGETLDGSLAVLGGNANLEQGSAVNGDLVIIGGELTIAGTVHGSVAVFGGSTTLEETAVIQGNFASYGGAIVRAPGATILGAVTTGSGGGPSVVIPRIQAPFVPAWPFQPSGGSGLGHIISWELGALGAGLLLALLGVLAVLIAPKAMGRIASAAAGQPAFTFGVGLLTAVVAILGGTLLLIACCTGLFVWLALLVALLVGWIAVGLWLGQWLLAALKLRPASSLVEVAVGVFIITFLGRLPLCIGFLFSVIVGCIGLGAVVLTRVGTQPAGSQMAMPPSDDGGGEFRPLDLPSVGGETVPAEPGAQEHQEPPSAPEAIVPPSDEPSALESEPVSVPPESPAPAARAPGAEPDELKSPEDTSS